MTRKRNGNFIITFNSNNKNFSPVFSKQESSFLTPVEIDNNSVKETPVNENENSFSSEFTEEMQDFSTSVKPKSNSIEEIFYDDIVFYDGGGVKGYGDN